MSRCAAVATGFVLIAVALPACNGTSQAPPVTGVVQQTPSAATKIEGFKPAVGSVMTLGYDELGSVGAIELEVREMRDSKGADVKGLLVRISESEYKKGQAFIDADEIPELLKGIDAILEVNTNPTSFKNFEVRYTTRGALQFTAFNNSSGNISYAVQAGRVAEAQKFIDAADMRKLRAIFVVAQTKLAAAQAKLKPVPAS